MIELVGEMNSAIVINDLSSHIRQKNVNRRKDEISVLNIRKIISLPCETHECSE